MDGNLDVQLYAKAVTTGVVPMSLFTANARVLYWCLPCLHQTGIYHKDISSLLSLVLQISLRHCAPQVCNTLPKFQLNCCTCKVYKFRAFGAQYTHQAFHIVM